MKRLLIGLLIAPAALAVLTTAAQARPQIHVEPQQPRAGEPFNLSIVGDQKDSCVPELLGMELKHRQIIIRGNQSSAGCIKADSHYEINLDPLATQPEGMLETGVYEIKFFVSMDADPLARLQAFELLQIGETEPAIRPEGGLWWAEAGGLYATSGPGTGFSIEVQDDRLVMMSNAYDLGGGPDWFFSSGILDGNLARASLLSLRGGQSLFGDYAAPETVLESGRVLIHFHSPATATAYFLTGRNDSDNSDLLLHPISLVRYAFARGRQTELLTGKWMVVIEQEQPNANSIRYDFKAGSPRRNGDLVFADEQTGARMDCDNNALRPSSPSAICQLTDTANGVDIVFDQMGLDRLYGWTETGLRATAIRWQR